MRSGRGRAAAGRGARIAEARSAAGILVAAGEGSRFAHPGGAVPKQFAALSGRPVICWSLDALLDAGLDQVVVAVPHAWLDRAADLVGDHPAVTIVSGGATRQASVAAGLARIDNARVVVHDAVRPVAPARLVRAVLSALGDVDAAVAATPVDETLKLVRDGRVLETVDRGDLWSTQTPQAFVTDRLRTAHEEASKEGLVATDDAQLIERYGGHVAIVESARTNIKITYPEDLVLAESLARVLLR